MTKDMLCLQRTAWANAMQRVAQEAGAGSPLYRAMGPLAWGRYDGEPNMKDTKDNVVKGLAYIQGKRDALLEAGRVTGAWPTSSLERIHVYVQEYLAR